MTSRRNFLLGAAAAAAAVPLTDTLHSQTTTTPPQPTPSRAIISGITDMTAAINARLLQNTITPQDLSTSSMLMDLLAAHLDETKFDATLRPLLSRHHDMRAVAQSVAGTALRQARQHSRFVAPDALNSYAIHVENNAATSKQLLAEYGAVALLRSGALALSQVRDDAFGKPAAYHPNSHFGAHLQTVTKPKPLVGAGTCSALDWVSGGLGVASGIIFYGCVVPEPLFEMFCGIDAVLGGLSTLLWMGSKIMCA